METHTTELRPKKAEWHLLNANYLARMAPLLRELDEAFW
jgi:hypothetical protein